MPDSIKAENLPARPKRIGKIKGFDAGVALALQPLSLLLRSYVSMAISTNPELRSDKSVEDLTPETVDESVPPPFLHCASMLSAVVVPTAGMGYAIFYAWSTGHFGWFDAIILLVGMWLSGIGISVGYHRMLTHRAFDSGPLTRNALTTLGALTLQEGPLWWCAAHRKHHAHSDRDGDPHSPHLHDGSFKGVLSGLWFAHTGWLFTSHTIPADYEKYVPDLLADKFACWVQDYWEVVFVPVTMGIPSLLGAAWFAWTGQPVGEGAFRGFVWGGLSRIFLVHHITWSVNSICHFWGSREFAVKDESRNNVICAVVSAGEGWHNNHHAFPSSARLGLRWWQFDNGWQVIRILEFLGLVWNVKSPSAEVIRQKELA